MEAPEPRPAPLPPFQMIRSRPPRPLLSAALALCCPGLLLGAPGAGQEAASEAPEVPRAETPIEVDGRLDESAWASALMLPLPWEIDPRENAPAPVETELLVTYDADAVYFGFRASDPEPERIRARLTDRDEAFDDDWVGVILDTFDDRRRAFEFFVNPLGVQMDLVRNEVGGGEDSSWDAIWTSAGRITPDGYTVEMAIPFTSLRFQGGSGPQTWGIFGFRSWPRSLRHQITSTRIDRDVDCFLCQAQRIRGFAGAEPGKNLEVTPTVTAGLTQERESFPGGSFADDGADVEPGVTALWGMTPNLTLAGTLNPDFSQVEADVAQLDVNQRFTLFFPEKRPFFLEDADLFETPVDAVFTRNIADPKWGIKVSGKAGSNALGALVAEDSVTNLLVPGSQGSTTVSLDRASTDAVARYRRDVGESSAVGVLATAREADGYSSYLYGADALVRFTDADSLSFQALGSETEYPAELAADLGLPAGSLDDTAFRLRYLHDDRNWRWNATWEERGELFRADLGFVSRVGVRNFRSALQRTWWGEDDHRWTRFAVSGVFDLAEDQAGNLLEREVELQANVSGPWQSFLLVEYGRKDQTFRGLELEGLDEVVVVFQVRPNASFGYFGFARVGEAIDFTNVQPADRIAVESVVDWNLGRRFELVVRHDFDRLDVDGGRLFTANLAQATAVYQIDVRTFVRLIGQYTLVDRDPERFVRPVEEKTEQLFTQLLFSYKVNPQTVLFAGYSDTHLGTADVALTQRDRTIFLKVGYAFVF